MAPEMINIILKGYSRLLTFLNNNGYDETIVNIKVIEDSKLQITLNDHMKNSYDVVAWVDSTGELHVENPVSHQSFFDVAEEFNMTPIDVEFIKFGDKIIYYTMKNAKWNDYEWDNNIFHFSFGDFVDEEGDEFYFRIEYRKKSDEFIFFMEYEEDELIYGYGDHGLNNIDEFFERHMSKNYMEVIICHMRNLMEKK